MKKLRVPLPLYRTTEMLDLAKQLSVKNISEGESSVLKSLSMDDFKTMVDKAAALHDEMETLRAHSAQRKLDRDAILKQISVKVRRCRDVLTGVHLENMKVMCDWGFNVIEATAVSTSKIKTSKKASKDAATQSTATSDKA